MKRLVRRFAGLEGSGFHRLSVAGAACVLAVTAAAAQQPRDARSEIAATATLSGRLMTDEQTPQPVARARMELSGEGQMNQSVMTDARGGFAFRGLAAGRYMLAAEKPGFVRTAYGARRAGRPGTPITLTEGQELANVSLKMARGSVITGTIRDELGQPAQGVSVRAMQFRMLNGERTLVPVALMNGPLDQMTDDRGVYRLFGLAADEYVLVATPRPLAPGDVRQMTPAEFQAVQRLALQMSGAPSTAQTPSAMPTVAYAPVFFPGTTTAADAIAIAVGPGEERAGVDLALQLVRTARIEGVVTAPGGAVPATELVMVPNGLTMSGLPMLPFSRSRPDVDGRFSFPGVSPGKYTISARMPSGQYWASADVAVDGENVSGVSLNLQPGLTISGRIALEGAPVAAPDLASARVSLTPGGSGMMLIGVGGSSEAKVDAQGWFTLANVVPGQIPAGCPVGVCLDLQVRDRQRQRRAGFSVRDRAERQDRRRGSDVHESIAGSYWNAGGRDRPAGAGLHDRGVPRRPRLLGRRAPH